MLRSRAWYARMFMLLAGIVLLSIAAATWLALWEPYDGVIARRSGYVRAVMDDGPTHAAGIRPGDTLLAVDGIPLYRYGLGYRLDREVGDRLRYEVLRDGHRLVIPVVLANQPLRHRIWQLQDSVLWLSFFLVGLALWMGRPTDQTTRHFFLMAQAAALLFVLDQMAELLIWRPALLLADLALYAAGALACTFYASFPISVRPTAGRWLRPAVYGSALVLAAWGVVENVLGWETDTSVAYRTSRDTWMLVVCMLAIGLVARRSHGASPRALRRRRLLRVGMAGSLLPLVVLYMIPQTFSGTGIDNFNWGSTFLLLLPLSFWYALKSGELGRADLVFDRGLLMLASQGALLFAVGIAWVLVGRFMHDPTDGGFALLFLAVLAAPLFSPIQHAIHRVVDHLAYGGWYNYQSLVLNASERLGENENVDELGSQLVELACQMRFEQALFLWRDGDRLTPRCGYGFDEALREGWTYPASGPLAEVLAVERRVLSRSDLLAMTPLAECPPLLSDPRARICISLAPGGQLLGTLVLGERQAGHTLDAQDYDILNTVRNHAAVAAENVFLMERLRGRVREVEEARTRELMAREDERVDLARDLHDEPLQTLFGLQHHMAGLHESLPDAESREWCTFLLQQLTDTRQKLNDICHGLRDPLLAEGGVEAKVRHDLRQLAREWPDIEITADLEPDGRSLPESVRIHLYGIYREAIWNAIKHAHPSRIHVTFAAGTGTIELRVRDNGSGFRVPAVSGDLVRDGHHGLNNMCERAAAIGGTLKLLSNPGGGAEVRMTAPADGRSGAGDQITSERSRRASAGGRNYP